MAKGYKHGSGGSNPLNLRIVGGTTKPSNPFDNTLWLNTSVDIPNWAFCPEQPNDPANGMVWFPTAGNGSLPFSILKKNRIDIYTIGQKQYVDEKWVDLSASFFTNGEWVDIEPEKPSVYWIEKGNVNESIGKSFEVGASSKFDFSFSGYFKHTLVANTSGYIRSAEKVDITKHKTLGLMCIEQSGGTLLVGICSDSSGSNFTAFGEKSTMGAGKISVDVESITGSYYLFYKGTGSSGTSDAEAKISDIYLV